MTDHPSPGPLWLWATAWGLQGAALLLADRLGIEDGTVRWGVTGALAAVPLAGLYLVLRLRAGRGHP